MANFKYESISMNGVSKKGTIEAPNKELAITELRKDGSIVLSIKKATALDKDIEINIGAAVSPRELSVFCRQFQGIINSGATVVDALSMLSEQTSNKKFASGISDVRALVQQGYSLYSAMETFPELFPEIMIHMVQAGEESGSLDVAFERLAVQFEKSSHLRGLIVKAMIYPIILILVIIGIVIIMMVKIVPTFTESFAEVGASLPPITVAVMAISDFMVHRGWMFIVFAVVAAWGIREAKKTDKGAMFFGQLALKAPLFGNLTIKSASASFTRTLSILTSSGIALTDALVIIEKLMTNHVVKAVIRTAQKEVVEGVPLSKPLAESEVFPPMVYQMVEIGEETGNLQEMLDRIADYYDEEVEIATQSLMAAMEPLIIVVMACIVFPIVLAVLMPMYSLYDAIG